MRKVIILSVIVAFIVGLGVLGQQELRQGAASAVQAASSPECQNADGDAADVNSALQFVHCAFRHQKALSIKTDEAALRRKRDVEEKARRDPANILDKFGVNLIISVSGDDYGWSSGSQKQMLSDMSSALRRFTNLAPLAEYDGVIMLLTHTKRDDYGNLITGNAARISIGRSSLGRINWEHFRPENLPRIAHDFESKIDIDGPLQQRTRQ
jgi:hypothetical protein